MRDDQDPSERTEVRRGGEILPGERVGDRRYRVSRRPEPHAIPVPLRAQRRRAVQPAVFFIEGFALFIIVGALFLMLPISSAAGSWTPFIDALFTATSAVCVTGLVVVDTATYWSGFGQIVVLLLIQAGGLGFMLTSTLLLLLLRRESSLRERLLLREALGSGSLGTGRDLARRVIVFTAIAEVVGAVILSLGFLDEAGFPLALWWGLFHAVSAFNNAGFDVIGGFRSLTPFSHQPVVLLTIAALFITGGISYLVAADVVRRRLRGARLTLDTKLVLLTTAGLVVLGTVGLLFTERANEKTLGALETGPRLVNAFFSAVTPRTAGFNSIDTGGITDTGLFLIMALMFIGASAGSTAGGIKIQTFSLLFFAIVSAVRGHPDVEAFRRRVPVPEVMRAISVALLSVAIVFATALALTVTEPHGFISILFEAASAFGTVGLSTGITPETTELGRAILIATMFAGRLGPLTLVVALAARERRSIFRWREESVRIG